MRATAFLVAYNLCPIRDDIGFHIFSKRIVVGFLVPRGILPTFINAVIMVARIYMQCGVDTEGNFFRHINIFLVLAIIIVGYLDLSILKK